MHRVNVDYIMFISLWGFHYHYMLFITGAQRQCWLHYVDCIMLITLWWLHYQNMLFFTGASRLRPCGLHHVDCVMLINLLWLHYHYMWFIIGATRLWDHVDSDGAPRGLWVWQWLGGRGRGPDRYPPQHVCPHHEVSAIVHKIL